MEKKENKIPLTITLHRSVIEMMDKAREETKISKAQFISNSIVEYVQAREELAKLRKMTLEQIIEHGIKKQTDR